MVYTLANGGSGWPPDENGDVGPNHYIQVVNTSVGIFEKASGALLTEDDVSDLFPLTAAAAPGLVRLIAARAEAALTAELTPDYDERTRLSSIKFMFAFTAGAGSIIAFHRYSRDLAVGDACIHRQIDR